MKPTSFSELFEEARGHEDYDVAGVMLELTEGVVREMERQGISREGLARRLDVSPAYVTKILRGKANFTLAMMVRLARALDAELHVQINAGTAASTAHAGDSSSGLGRDSMRERFQRDLLKSAGQMRGGEMARLTKVEVTAAAEAGESVTG